MHQLLKFYLERFYNLTVVIVNKNKFNIEKNAFGRRIALLNYVRLCDNYE